VSTRANTRGRALRRLAIVAGVLVLLALLLLASGHWLIGLLVAVAAAVAVWSFIQARSVR
jgi:hypothetical protein